MDQTKGMNVCVRCLQPLNDSDSRFNYVFWGMAHKRCAAEKVWPPRFRPPQDPNEVLKQIFALCSLFAKLSAGYIPPTILPDVVRVAAPPVAVRAAPREEKETRSEFRPSLTPARKRRTAPPKSPKATPSPKAKDAKQDEIGIKAPTGRQRLSEKQSSQKKERRSRKKSEGPTPLPPSNQQSSMREYDLSRRVRAGGGQSKMEDDQQYRTELADGVTQYLEVDGEPERTLETWQDRSDYQCERCGEARSRPATAQADSYRSWVTGVVEICLRCVPVALRVQTYSEAGLQRGLAQSRT